MRRCRLQEDLNRNSEGLFEWVLSPDLEEMRFAITVKLIGTNIEYETWASIDADWEEGFLLSKVRMCNLYHHDQRIDVWDLEDYDVIIAIKSLIVRSRFWKNA